MNILHLCTSEQGGAGRAAYRLNTGLSQIGLQSHLLTQRCSTPNQAVSGPDRTLGRLSALLKLPERVDALPLRLYRRSSHELFSVQWWSSVRPQQIAHHHPDIINLHWINFGFVSIRQISRLPHPIVWTLHDMWAFTGGCHYSGDCQQYRHRCGTCPQLNSVQHSDLSRWVWECKQKAWKQLNLTVVAPSRWMAQAASSSSLFRDVRIDVIPNGLDLQRYKPVSKNLARTWLNLSQDKHLVLFCAADVRDRRKGFSLLLSALEQLSQTDWRDRVELIVVGADAPPNPLPIGLPIRWLGRLHDDISLSLIYAAADLFVAPSQEDNLPNTVVEAMACGTPTVAFNIGGLSDLVTHRQNGYLAKPYEISDLTQGIIWLLNQPERYEQICNNARAAIEQEFSLERQAKRYEKLYDELLRRDRSVVSQGQSAALTS